MSEEIVPAGVTTVRVVEVDVAVVGAGPAGLAAATTAAESGLTVAVVDAGIQPGGQYWRHPDEDTATGAEAAGHHDWAVFTRLRTQFQTLRQRGVLHYLPSRQVWFIERPASPGGRFTLRINRVIDGVGPMSGPTQVRARSVILCPGGYDRQLPIPGWDLPGSMAAGGVQALLKGHRSLAGRRALVAGTGPFLLPVATGLADAGAEVVGICEAGAITSWLRHLGGAVQVPSKGLEGVTYAAALLKHRIPYRTRTAVTAIHGETEVDSATLADLDRDGRVVRGSGRTVAVDLVALGWGFTPSLELIVAVGAETRLDADRSLVACVDEGQRSSVPDVYVAGEATGVGGARLAVQEGELAALTAAADRGVSVGSRGAGQLPRAGQLQRAIRRSRAFARSMHLAHPVPTHWPEWLTEDTTVCRCEEVSYGQICHARDALGAQDARTVKLLARPGMGWCQGRVCGFATAALAAADSGRDLTADDLRPMAKKPLAAPVSLGELADLDEELAT
jgi:NADPH-dependent 2,4-dienoyl-CoA reductase/sulfur reductase-like enzyme